MAGHMGFKAAAASVAKSEGIPMRNAQAVIAAGAMKASPAAKKANPRLNRVANAQDGAYRAKAKKALAAADKARY